MLKSPPSSLGGPEGQTSLSTLTAPVITRRAGRPDVVIQLYNTHWALCCKERCVYLITGSRRSQKLPRDDVLGGGRIMRRAGRPLLGSSNLLISRTSLDSRQVTYVAYVMIWSRWLWNYTNISTINIRGNCNALSPTYEIAVEFITKLLQLPAEPLCWQFKYNASSYVIAH
jgi:hypothetical protein